MADLHFLLDEYLHSLDVARRVQLDPNRSDSAVRSAASHWVMAKADLIEAIDLAERPVLMAEDVE